MSIRDVMATDYEHLMAVLGAGDAETGQDGTIMNLGDFINSL